MANREHHDMAELEDRIYKRLDQQENRIDKKLEEMSDSVKSACKSTEKTNEAVQRFVETNIRREEREKSHNEEHHRFEKRMEELEKSNQQLREGAILNDFKTNQNYTFLQKYGASIAIGSIIVIGIIGAFVKGVVRFT